jgi:EAL domain-containing protein (putative c-di-GMP-specific phosphodiesterase class I)
MMSADSQLVPESAKLLASDPPFTFALQPIVDTVAREVVGWEALIRGPWGEPAWQVFNQVSAPDLHLFDQTARIAAVALAGRLGIDGALHLNLLPQSLDSYPKSILATIEAAQQAGIAAHRVVLEVPEAEIIHDRAHFAVLLKEARALGVRLAIDDFGATFASLTLLDDLEPDQIKLDMRLTRGVDRGGPRQAILRAVRRACYDLKIDVVAEGVETLAEYQFLAGQRIRLFQGYLFAKPAFEAFPAVNFPEAPSGEATKPPARATAARSRKRA